MLATDLRRHDAVRGLRRLQRGRRRGRLGRRARGRGARALPRRVGRRAADQRFFLVFVPVALAGRGDGALVCPRPSSPPTATRPGERRLGAIPAGRAATGRPVRPRLVRRRVRRPGVHRLLARPPLRRHHRPRSASCSPPSGVLQTVSFLAAGRLARALRSAAHDGVHPPAVEPAPRRAWRSRRACRSPSRCCSPAPLLSQMDVPTRQAYVMALVDPDERTAAAATTNTRPLRRPGPSARSLAGAARRVASRCPRS